MEDSTRPVSRYSGRREYSRTGRFVSHSKETRYAMAEVEEGNRKSCPASKKGTCRVGPVQA